MINDDETSPEQIKRQRQYDIKVIITGGAASTTDLYAPV